MDNESRSYKYSCRKCTIRQRCIDEKSFGPGLKMSIVQRFENRTDTFETWDMLQQDCLLIRYEQQRSAKRPYIESTLAKRLRQARKDAHEPPPAQSQDTSTAEKKGLVTRVPWMPPQRPATSSGKPAAEDIPDAITPCGLAVAATQRLVRLPDHGDIVLGRFEHGFSNPPDVDLTFDDGEIPSISRRHVLVMGRGGVHTIEDLGSSNGTYVNGHPVPLGKGVTLNPGDRLLVGRCRMAYAPLPDWVLEPDPRVPHISSLLVTHSGAKIRLPDQIENIIGRPDPELNHVPDIDLSIAGDIAMYVSRRHVRLVQRSGWHFLEELGSAAGTRINGRPIWTGDPPVMLNHGDHIWLGGCVVAYEWQII